MVRFFNLYVFNVTRPKEAGGECLAVGDVE